MLRPIYSRPIWPLLDIYAPQKVTWYQSKVRVPIARPCRRRRRLSLSRRAGAAARRSCSSGRRRSPSAATSSVSWRWSVVAVFPLWIWLLEVATIFLPPSSRPPSAPPSQPSAHRGARPRPLAALHRPFLDHLLRAADADRPLPLFRADRPLHLPLRPQEQSHGKTTIPLLNLKLSVPGSAIVCFCSLLAAASPVFRGSGSLPDCYSSSCLRLMPLSLISL